jgi:hypothetical protein
VDAGCARLLPHRVEHPVEQFDVFFRSAVDG